MQAHQERVRAERAELEEKRSKLACFIGNDQLWPTVVADEQQRLIRQHALMAEYIDVLDERIAAFAP